MAMLRIASSKVVPSAVRAISSGRILCGSITNAFNGCDHVYTVPLAVSHHFSTDAKRQSDRKLMKFLKSEIKLKQMLLDREMPAPPNDFPFTVKEDHNDIILTRDYEGEKIDVGVVMPADLAEEDESDSDSDDSATDVDDDVSSGDDDDDGDKEEENEPLSLRVKISKENGRISEFDVSIDVKEVKIKSFSVTVPEDEITSFGPHDVDEEGDFQNWLGRFLEIRGIKKDYYGFLYEYMVKKCRKRPVIALKKLREFIAE